VSIPMYVPPEQLIKDRAEFARKGIARGRSILLLEYADGVLLIGVNPSGSLHKVSEIYDRIAFAGVGRFNEFESLRVAGIRYADLKGYAYGRTDVSARGLANAYAQTLGQFFTHELKPYEIEVMVAEVGADLDETHLYRIQFDGTLTDVYQFGAMGGKEDELASRLGELYRTGLDLNAAINLAVSSIEAVEERTVADGDWEGAVLDRNLGRRAFRRLTTADFEEARRSGGETSQ